MPNILDSALNLFRKRGEKIKAQLGLPQSTQVVIQRIIDYPTLVYIVSYNSRRPTVMPTTSMCRRLKGTYFRRVSKGGLGSIKMKNYKLTPAININYSDPTLSENTLFIIRDFGGDYILRMKEAKELNLNLIG